MVFLQAEGLSKSFGTRVLFTDITFTIAEGQKIALVARNGEGKSTLLKILIGQEIADTGKVTLNKNTRTVYLPQEPSLISGKTILENVFTGGGSMAVAVAEYEKAMEEHAHADNPQTTRALQDATSKMDALEAWDYELKIRQILSRLGITNLEQKVDTLSGGQKKRVALARVLIEEPELLILDEPTNHLDVDMIEWLEEYLSRSRMALLLVTHDRYFLDSVSNEILEMEGGKLFRYTGNYASYLEKKAEREQSETATRESARNLLRKELEWMRKQPRARGTKAKYRVNAFYDLQDKAAGPAAQAGIEVNVGMQRLGKKIISFEHVKKSFPGKEILSDFTYSFQKGERVGIVGPNGIGKTTFLDILTGRQAPDDGKIETGETVAFGYFTQQSINLPEDKRVIEVISDIADVITTGNGSQLSASQLLQQFGFDPPRQYTPVSSLSGGEKRRLQLLTILIKNPNFLVLDEPTNDLDIVTLTTLEDFLLGFGGCLIVVSHDRFFLDKLCQHLFVFAGNGHIKDYNGSYSEYREMIKDEEKNAKFTQAPSLTTPAPSASPASGKRKPSYNEKKEYETLEKEIEKLETRRAEIEGLMAAGQGSHTDFQSWAAEMELIKKTLAKKEDRWLELGELF
jgi:ATP-binding cassette subfamily F protein uup